eukprot:2798668-Amphidinium_carterae.1
MSMRRPLQKETLLQPTPRRLAFWRPPLCEASAPQKHQRLCFKEINTLVTSDVKWLEVCLLLYSLTFVTFSMHSRASTAHMAHDNFTEIASAPYSKVED